jgi:hypothetical protein
MADPAADYTNSFILLDDANTYFNNDYQRYKIWDGLSDADRSRLLIKATDILTYNVDWKVPLDTDDYSDSNIYQKNACCEQAWANYGKDRLQDAEEKGLSVLQVETIMINFDKTDRTGIIAASALNLLRDQITSAPGSLNVPIERA